MPAVNAGDIICSLFQAHDKGRLSHLADNTQEARVFSLKLHGSHSPGEDNYYEADRFVHVALFGGGNYVNVWGAISGQSRDDWHPTLHDLPADKWHYYASHDSAWRQDGVENILRQAEQELIADLAEQSGKELFHKDVHFSNHMEVEPEKVAITLEHRPHQEGRQTNHNNEGIAEVTTLYAWQRDHPPQPEQENEQDRDTGGR